MPLIKMIQLIAKIIQGGGRIIAVIPCISLAEDQTFA